MVAGDVQQKDVIITVLTASAALVGLVLVFLGLIVSSYEGYDAGQQASVDSRYKTLGWWVMAGFVVGLACVGLATAWLLWQGEWEYRLTVVAFAVQLLLLVAASGLSVRSLLWD